MAGSELISVRNAINNQKRKQGVLVEHTLFLYDQKFIENAFEEDKKEAIRAGMNGHIAKPVKASALMRSMAGIFTRE